MIKSTYNQWRDSQKHSFLLEVKLIVRNMYIRSFHCLDYNNCNQLDCRKVI